MCAQKLGMLELRTQEMRADAQDIGRSITNYLSQSCNNSVSYMQEGVRRICQSWVESRRMQKDLDSSEFGPAWQASKKMGFDHALESFKQIADTAKALGYAEDAAKAVEHIAKFEEVFANPIEELDKY